LKHSLDQEGAVCLRQESNLASGKCCCGLLLKLALAWRNSESKNWMEALSQLLTHAIFLLRESSVVSEEFGRL